MTLSWTREHDRVWGPFLYAPDKRPGWRPLAIIVSSGGDEDPGADVRFSGFGHTIKIALPRWLVPPQRVKKFPDWDAETVKRLGRNWYWDITEREFGFQISEGHVSLKYGRQTHDSSTEKNRGFFLPWTQWRFIEHRYFTPDGALLRTFPSRKRKGAISWDEEYQWRQSIPKAGFEFSDFDGERIEVRAYVEERVWRFGEGWFKWLSLFRKTKVRRSLDLAFSAEVGPRKGSWKGGTVGHSCEIAQGETPEAAFRKYCEKHGLTFIGPLKEVAHG